MGKYIKARKPCTTSYGVEWDETKATTLLTRIGNLNMHRTLPVQSLMRGCTLLDNGSVNYYLDENDWSLKDDGVTPSILDGTDGQVMVEIPEFWIKYEDNGDKKSVLISIYNESGFTRVPKMYISAYEATVRRTDNKLSSVVNSTPDYRGGDNDGSIDNNDNSLLGRPASSFNRTEFRDYARARGSVKWNCYHHEARKILFWLYYIEYGNSNCQTAFTNVVTTEGYKQGGLGLGVTTANSDEWSNFNGRRPFVPCGHTNSLGNKTGVVNYSAIGWLNTPTFEVPRYRGVENPFGHIWEWTDGINVRIQADSDGGKSEVYIADTMLMSDSDYSGYTKVGELPRSNGYISKLIFSDGDIMPREASGGSSTYWSDNFYTSIPSSGEELRGVLSGGHAPNGSAAGFGYSSTPYAPSYSSASLGSRLCFFSEGV